MSSNQRAALKLVDALAAIDEDGGGGDASGQGAGRDVGSSSSSWGTWESRLKGRKLGADAGSSDGEEERKGATCLPSRVEGSARNQKEFRDVYMQASLPEHNISWH